MIACIPYTFLWALAVSATIAGVVFFLVFIITFAQTREEAFDFAHDVIGKPAETKEAIVHLIDIVPVIINDVNALLDGVDQFDGR